MGVGDEVQLQLPQAEIQVFDSRQWVVEPANTQTSGEVHRLPPIIRLLRNQYGGQVPWFGHQNCHSGRVPNKYECPGSGDEQLWAWRQFRGYGSKPLRNFGE